MDVYAALASRLLENPAPWGRGSTYVLFVPYLNHSSLVWTTTAKQNLNKTLLSQEKILRHVANIPRLASTKMVLQD